MDLMESQARRKLYFTENEMVQVLEENERNENLKPSEETSIDVGYEDNLTARQSLQPNVTTSVLEQTVNSVYESFCSSMGSPGASLFFPHDSFATPLTHFLKTPIVECVGEPIVQCALTPTSTTMSIDNCNEAFVLDSSSQDGKTFAHQENAQADVVVHLESIVSTLRFMVDSIIQWPGSLIASTKILIENFNSWFRNKILKSFNSTCDCGARIKLIETQMEGLVAEVKRLQLEQHNLLNQRINPINHNQEAMVLAPRPPPIPPPPPPPPPCMLPPPNVTGTFTKNTPAQKPKSQNQPQRVAITAQDLQSVRLRKVGDRVLFKDSPKVGGPMVTLEQLRSVKLRSRRKTPSNDQSPTRTTLARERMRKLRSPTVRRETKRSRIHRIPLSTILNMDE